MKPNTILTLAIVVAVGFVGYTYYQSQQATAAANAANGNNTIPPGAGALTNPSNWFNQIFGGGGGDSGSVGSVVTGQGAGVDNSGDNTDDSGDGMDNIDVAGDV